MSQIKTKYVENNAITNAKAAQMPANTIKGNNTGSTANATDLTASQVTTLINSANQQLTNLSSTAVNTSLLPGTDNTLNLGSSSKTWASGYIRMLTDFLGTTSIDITNRKLYDVNGVQSADYNGRTLNYVSGTGVALNWSPTAVTAGGMQLVSPGGNTQLTVANGGAQVNTSLLFNGSTSGAVTVAAPATTTSYSLTLPPAQASGTQVLQNNGSGVLSWVTSTSTAAGALSYNFLVNGAFDYWQSGVSATATNVGGASHTLNSTSQVYGPDQWYAQNTLGGGTINGVISFAQLTGVTNGSKFGCLLRVTTAPTGTGLQNGCELYHVLSNAASISLYGQTASFSVQVLGRNNVTQVGIQFFYATSESKLTTAIGSEVLTTVNSSTFVPCTINGQALGTAQTTSGVIGVRIRPTAVSSGNLYDVNNGFVAEQAIVNLGSVAGSFARQYNDPSKELAACQYFYETSYDVNVTPATVTNNGAYYFTASGTDDFNTIFYKVGKRITTGTITYYSPVTGASAKIRNVTVAADVSPTATPAQGSTSQVLRASTTSTAVYSAQWVINAQI